jgi:hypothetical protein
MSWEEIKNRVRRRDSFICQNCGLEERDKSFHVHHIVPRSDGGIDHPDNLVLLCPSCHSKLEGTRRNPTYLGNSVRLIDIVSSFELSNVLRFIERDIRSSTNHFSILFLKDRRICNRCLSNTSNIDTNEFQYSKSYSDMLEEFIRIGLNGGDVEHIIESDSLFYGNIRYKCGDCGGSGLDFSNNLDEYKFYSILDNVHDVLLKKGINFCEDVLNNTAKRMYVLPQNQCRELRVLERAVNYSVHCGKFIDR